MSELIPLKIPFGHYIFGNDSYTANEPPNVIQELAALPSLKAKLDYFNKNIKSLALCSNQSAHKVFAGTHLNANLFCIRPNCLCGLRSTAQDEAIYLKARAAEIKRLNDELAKWETYVEKVAYLINQPGFFLHRLYFEEIDLRPDMRPPADIEAFNELSKRHFEQSYFPNHYRGALFSREKETITARLAKADDPVYQVEFYRQEIKDYTGYKRPKEPVDYDSNPPELVRVHRHNDWFFREARAGEYTLSCRAKDTFLKCAAGIDAAPNLFAEPLYDEEWEAIEHGQQLYQLYQWLGQWQPGKEIDDTNTSEAAELKYCADIYALYHWIMIKMKRCQAFRLNDFDKWPKKDIQAAAETLYLKGRDWWKPNTFYKGFKKANETPMENFPMVFGAEYKQKLIAISGNDPAVIEHLKGYPD